MVLAVDIGRDGAADRDLAGPWCDGDEPSLGDDEPEQAIEGEASVHGDRARLWIEGPYGVEIHGVDDRSADRLRGIAVGPAPATGDHRGPIGAHGVDLDRIVGPEHLTAHRVGAAPTRELLQVIAAEAVVVRR